MKNVLACLIALTLCVGLLASCAIAEEIGYAPVNLENYNRTLTFSQKPANVVALTLNSAEIIAALGEADSLTAIARNNNTVDDVLPQYADLLKDRNFPEEINGMSIPTMEGMMGMGGELVIANSYYFIVPQIFGSMEDYEANGIDFYVIEGSYIPNATIENTYNDICNIGAIFGRNDEAEALVADMRTRIEVVQEKVAGQEPVAVLSLDSLEEDLFYVAGGAGLAQNMIELAGGRNVFDDMERQFGSVGIEEIIARNPEVIVIHSYTAFDAHDTQNKIDYLLNTPELSEVSAVKNGNIIVVPLIAVNPGLQNVDYIEQLAAAMYPDLFE